MVRHIAGLAEIVDDVGEAVRFYRDSLGFPVREESFGYAVVEVPGVLHFGIWSREAAAESTFGDPAAAPRIPLGFTVGFEVDDLGSVPLEPTALRRGVQEEPWGQRTLRFSSPSGALCELSETPGARRLVQDAQAEG